MSGTKRTKGSSTRKTAAGGAVGVIDKRPEVIPVRDDFGELDDILGEIAPPPRPEPSDALMDVLGELDAVPKTEKADDLDDLLSEIAGPPAAEASNTLDDMLAELTQPTATEPADDLDSLLSEIAGPATSDTADSLDDILSEVTGPPATAAADDLDSLLSEIAGPAGPEAADGLDDILDQLAAPPEATATDGFDDILSEIAGPASAEKAAGEAKARPSRGAAGKAAEPADSFDDLAEMLSEVTSLAPAGEAGPPAAGKKPKRAGRLQGAARPDLKGKREISRRAYFGMQGAIAILSLAVVGQGAFILTRPAHAPVKVVHAAPPQPVAVTIIPVDYSKVDLDRYIGKVRSLKEGGRDMLRHPRVKSAVLELDGGEELYKNLRSLAAKSPAADLMTIKNDRVTIASCNTPVCADKSFRLVYDIRSKHASVCMTAKYLNGSWLSYSYSIDGYSEQPSC